MLTGRVLEREGRLAEALAAYEAAVDRNAANPHARTAVVGVATRINRWEVADRHLRRLLDVGYQPARTRYALGRVAQAQGRTADAAAHYREAFRLEPGLEMAPQALQSLGIR